MKSVELFVLLLLFFGLIGCEQKTDRSGTMPGSKRPDEQYDRSKVEPARLKSGRELYLKNCTVCHGLHAEGAPDWRQRDKDGRFPAPPLNGTGHAWHHPKKALMNTIRNGTAALGGNMPAWKERLTDEQIESIVLWFQSQWPDQLYQAWVRHDQESK